MLTATYLYGAEGQQGTTIVPLIASTPADSTTFYFDTKGMLTDFKITETTKSAAVKPAPAPTEKSAVPVTASPAPADAVKPVQATTITTTAAGSSSKTRNVPAENSKFFPGATLENR
ncbi:MAG: hypothetical protein ABIS45_11235 [Burkholderiales bacterium]